MSPLSPKMMLRIKRCLWITFKMHLNVNCLFRGLCWIFKESKTPTREYSYYAIQTASTFKPTQTPTYGKNSWPTPKYQPLNPDLLADVTIKLPNRLPCAKHRVHFITETKCKEKKYKWIKVHKWKKWWLEDKRNMERI